MARSENDCRIDYIEMNVADIARSKSFYGAAFGWTFKDYGPDYCEFADGRLTGGFTTHGKPSPGGALIILRATTCRRCSAGSRRRAAGSRRRPTISRAAGVSTSSIPPDTSLPSGRSVRSLSCQACRRSASARERCRPFPAAPTVSRQRILRPLGSCAPDRRSRRCERRRQAAPRALSLSRAPAALKADDALEHLGAVAGRRRNRRRNAAARADAGLARQLADAVGRYAASREMTCWTIASGSAAAWSRRDAISD